PNVCRRNSPPLASGANSKPSGPPGTPISALPCANTWASVEAVSQPGLGLAAQRPSPPVEHPRTPMSPQTQRKQVRNVNPSVPCTPIEHQSYQPEATAPSLQYRSLKHG